MAAYLKPLAGHAVLLVFLELSALLTVARLGSEFVRRIGLPTVVGELAAGVLLGPTVFGHYFPRAFVRLFPRDPEQMHLLEILSWVGMVLLLLLTGIETDVRLLRNLGRAALGASVFGMIVPFIFGLGLGWSLPAQFVANPEHRNIFAVFLATAMSISAMPVIAKILLDLDLTRRNIGMVILSAGVVDDTTGWIVLSLIAGAATGGNQIRGFAVALGGTVVFLGFAAFVLYPLLRIALRIGTDRFHSKDTDLVVIIVTTLLCAATTDAIGVHAVFGAFVAGCVIRQVPRLRPETLHKLESVTFPIFAPIFFGMVGLKVDLWQLGDLRTLLVVLGVATSGKLLGCTVGSLLGGLRFWESISIAVAMNARGAMELVVATVGLSLGILNQQMYSIVVMVAVTTSFMAPVLLRLTMRRVRMTDEEAKRMASEAARGLFDAETLRVLVPTAGGPNALVAAAIAFCMTKRSTVPVTVLHVQRKAGLFHGVAGWLRPDVEAKDLTHHLDAIRSAAKESGSPDPEIRRDASRSVSEGIRSEATRGYHLVISGASDAKRGLQGNKLQQLVEAAPCHMAIIKGRGTKRSFKRLLVSVDGSFLSRFAIDFSVRYAEGADAEVAFVVVPEGGRIVDTAISRLDIGHPFADRRRRDSMALDIGAFERGEGLDRLSPVLTVTTIKTRFVMAGVATGSVLAMAASGAHDLLVLAAENRAVHHRLFFGYENERLVEEAPISVAVVVPRVTSAQVA
jgi:Kef-type K+ transport system membrane component KefB/nucleotide-binding universal stress UspA family protein